MNDSFLRYVDTDRSYLPKALDDAVSSVKEFDSVLPMCLIKLSILLLTLGHLAQVIFDWFPLGRLGDKFCLLLL